MAYLNAAAHHDPKEIDKMLREAPKAASGIEAALEDGEAWEWEVTSSRPELKAAG